MTGDTFPILIRSILQFTLNLENLCKRMCQLIDPLLAVIQGTLFVLVALISHTPESKFEFCLSFAKEFEL